MYLCVVAPNRQFCTTFPRNRGFEGFEKINHHQIGTPTCIKKVTKIKKITSGSSPEISDFVDELYGSIIKAGTHKASSIKVAEAAKSVENVQRDLNISLVNELAIIFDLLEHHDSYGVNSLLLSTSNRTINDNYGLFFNASYSYEIQAINVITGELDTTIISDITIPGDVINIIQDVSGTTPIMAFSWNDAEFTGTGYTINYRIVRKQYTVLSNQDSTISINDKTVVSNDSAQ